MAAKSATPEVARSLEWLLFSAAFIAFAYFHQGGGWNPNGRFAMVRALAEKGELSIDSYLVYERAKPDPSTELRRIPVHDAEFTVDGRTNVLVWMDAQGRPFPVSQILEGRVATVDASSKAIDVQIAKDANVTVSVTDATEIKRSQANLPFNAISVGQVVRVRSSLEQTGRAVAKNITLIDGDDLRDVTFTDFGIAAAGDVAFYRGHFYPNKAPGTSFIAMPAYWLVYHFEKIIGANPDEWWTLTLNAWLTCVLSVGLLSAIGVVLFYRLALAISGGRAWASLLTAFTFAFGTMFFLYATSLYEHNIIAVGLITSFYLLYRVKTERASGNPVDVFSDRKATFLLFLSGLCAGYAAITNYIIAVVVIFFGLYLIFTVPQKNGWLWFGLGVLGPFLLICAYNAACFGTPFTTNYRHQNLHFSGGANAFLGVFVWPQWDVLLAILFSPFRGLFFSSPVLLIGLAGLAWLFQDKSHRAEAWLFIATLGFLIFFNICFNGWDGGWTTVPRYLGPALPFLALPMVFGFILFPRTTCALAALSIAITLLTTAVDPQPPIGISGTAVVLDKPKWQYNPLAEYELPIFLTKRPWPLLHEQEAQVLRSYDTTLVNEGLPSEARQAEVEKFRQYIESMIAQGKPAPLILTRTGEGANAHYSVDMSDLPLTIGPVSANPGGIYGGWTKDGFGSFGSEQARWNSFNVGEFLFPQNRWSLLPLLLVDGALVWLALRAAGSAEILRR